MDLNLNFTYTQAQDDIHESTEKYVVVTKGRRLGATFGMAQNFVELLVTGYKQLLWVDTIYGNIDRYYERYFVPILQKNNIPYSWNVQKKVLKIFDGYIDFRSADRPENIEGFGYQKIFLNEAGIILKNKYLYTNAILPMLLDFPDSQLISAGVPKGKILKDGNEHPFYTLYKRGKEGTPNYRVFQFSSYDNPLLNKHDIEELESEIGLMSDKMVRQEVYGEFIDAQQGLIYEYWDKKKFDDSLPYVWGMDFGYSNDPTTLVKIAEKNNQIHCKQYLYKTHLSTEQVIKNLQVVVKPNDLIMSDNNEPRLIEAIRKAGFNIRATKKGSDSVRNGIMNLINKRFLVDPESKDLIKELLTYSWNDKKAGVPLKGNDHLLDAIRYAHEQLNNKNNFIFV